MNRILMITLLSGTVFLFFGATLSFSPQKVVDPHSVFSPSLTAENSGGIIILPHALPDHTA